MPQIELDTNITTETSPAPTNTLQSVELHYTYGAGKVAIDVTAVGHKQRRFERALTAQQQSTLETFIENAVKAILGVSSTTKIPDPQP